MLYDTFLFTFSFIIPLILFYIIFKILEKKSLIFRAISALLFVIALMFFLGFLEFVIMIAGGII